MTTSKGAFEGNARTWLRVLAVLLSFTCTAGTSRPATAAGNKDRAKKEFAIAEKFYKMGEFSQAVAHYKKAYDLAPFPAFLFNLGQCYKQLDNCERAVFYYSGYLREKPDAPNAAVVTKLLTECRTRLAEEAEATSRAATAKAEVGGNPPHTTSGSATGFALTDPRAPNAPDRRDETAPKSVWSQWWFWGTVAGVVVAGAATTAVLVWGRQVQEEPPSRSLGTIDAR